MEKNIQLTGSTLREIAERVLADGPINSIGDLLSDASEQQPSRHSKTIQPRRSTLREIVERVLADGPINSIGDLYE